MKAILYLIVGGSTQRALDGDLALERMIFHFRIACIFFLLVCQTEAASKLRQVKTLLGRLPIVIPVAVAGSAILLEGYSRLPQNLIFGSKPRPIVPFKETDAVIIFPGAGGPDENTSNLAKAIIDSDKICGIKRHVEVYDWSPWRGNLIRASFDGQSVGKIIGKQLAEEHKNLKSLHVMGVSVGAFAADSCSEEYQKSQTNNLRTTPAPYVRLTLLDPFTQRGLFGTKYGLKLFGKSATYCEQFLNTDDPVPSTNEAISMGFVSDITGSASRNDFVPLKGDSMHSWPVAYYGRKWVTKLNEDGTLYHPLHTAETMRGAVKKIP